MKKSIIFVLAMSAFVFAQTSYIEILKSDVKTQRRALVTAAMDFSEEEAQKFWPVCKDYEFEVDKLIDAEIGLFKEYAENYNEMSDKKADELVEKMMKIDNDQLSLKKKFYDKFKKALTAKRAAKFLQVDNRLDLMISLQKAEMIPVLE